MKANYYNDQQQKKLSEDSNWRPGDHLKKFKGMFVSKETQELEKLSQYAKLTFYSFNEFRKQALPDEFLRTFKESFSPQFNPEAAFKTGDGASGSFFFFSHDQKYILKTCSEDEIKQLVRVLPMMNNHFKTKKTIIAQTYGIFTM